MIELLKHQQRFIEMQEHEVIMLAPTAAGKTFVQLYDAGEYALRHPGSTQVYMCWRPDVMQKSYHDIFFKGVTFFKTEGKYKFENGSRLYLTDYGPDYALRFISYDVEIYRIDVDILDLSKSVYLDYILRRTYRPSEYPQAVKITAKDCLYSFTKRKEIHKIEVEYDDPDLCTAEWHKVFNKYIHGEWEE